MPRLVNGAPTELGEGQSTQEVQAGPCDGAQAPHRLNVGGHVALGTKPHVVMEELKADGFRSAQIFASSPSTWRVPAPNAERHQEVKRACEAAGIADLFIHAVYLINLAGDERIYENSIRSLIWTLQAGAEMGARGVILHTGSHRGAGFESVRMQVCTGLERILARRPESVLLLLENSAGAGGCIGADIDELGAIVRDLGAPEGLGICLDTAHIFEMGCDIRSCEQVDHLLESLGHGPGLDRLAIIHANDSKTPCGSRRDRHANIGEGEIGLAGFANILSRPEFRALPLILETPKLERRVDDLAALQAAYEGAVGGPDAGSEALH